MFHPPDRVVDLTNPIDPGMPVWPTFPPVELNQTDWAARDGATMERVEMRSHTATHVDAPLHFIPEGKTVTDYPLSKFMAEGVVLDLTPKSPGEAITVDDLAPYDEEIRSADAVMLHTDWDEYYGHTPEYLFEFPYLTGDAASYLADRDLDAVGTEALSVAGWTDTVPNHGPTTEVPPAASHRPLLERDTLPIEELRNLDRVLDGADTRRAYFMYPPLRLRGAGGASVRAFALL
jgi:kynurenine formamidase